MDFGIVTAKVDEIGYITHAENLGFTHCWVTDSQMIRSNCWAVLALAARDTRRRRSASPARPKRSWSVCARSRSRG
jgi:alkanesulfonate monooxygenase SsuD/methylene tetrahydromethanopterin reductase-like flavin-dependent oxidoreductase (luciferase family)